MTASTSSVIDEFNRDWRFNDPAEHQSALSEPVPKSGAQTPMWSFASGGIRLFCDRAVQVEFGQDGDGFYASCDRLHVYSSGSSYKDCIQEFQRQVIHFYLDYSSLQTDEVVGLAKELRDLYLGHFSSGK